MSNRTQHSGPSAADRSVRSLVQLESSGSTARTLNLLAVWKRHAETEDYQQRPFFRNTVLNRAIILKHRLRDNERGIFRDGRFSATKVILPIDITDLRSGARSFFVGERGFIDLLRQVSSVAREIDSHDADLLELLNTLPSLDPFLMRERLQKNGYNPARCYFDLTEADVRRMFQFARQEVAPLVGMSFQDVMAVPHERADKLATKILSNAGDVELEPLRLGMSMSRADFAEGVFCWKGFIYYKWMLMDLLPQVQPVVSELENIAVIGPAAFEDKAQIVVLRTRLKKAAGVAVDTVRATLKVYDDAYADLTRNGQPAAFREFLLSAPELFYALGERLGAIQHLISFWRYRFPEGRKIKLAVEDVIDLLADFEASLSFAEPER